MKITYDQESDAMNIQFQEGKYDVSKRMPIENMRDITVEMPIKSS